MGIFKHKRSKIPKDGITIYTFNGTPVYMNTDLYIRVKKELETKSKYQFFQDNVRCIAMRT